jgi:heme exporter protein B
LQIFITLLNRELRLLIRNQERFMTLLLFYALTLLIFPFALSSEAQFLSKAAPGLFWIVTIFTILLSVEPFYKNDLKSGMFTHFFLEKTPFPFVFFSKILAHMFLLFCLNIFVIPFLWLLFGLSKMSVLVLGLSAILGIPTIVALIHFGTTLTLTSNGTPIFVLVIILPFLIPCLIFSTGLVTSFNAGLPLKQPLLFLGAILLFVYALTPWIASYALKESVRE